MHALQVMGLLTGYYRRILRLDDPALRTPADAVAALGGKVKEYPARKALDQARALGAGGLRQAFDALFQADLDLKGARGIPEQAVMEVLVVRLARLAARTGGRGRVDGELSARRSVQGHAPGGRVAASARDRWTAQDDEGCIMGRRVLGVVGSLVLAGATLVATGAGAARRRARRCSTTTDLRA